VGKKCLEWFKTFDKHLIQHLEEIGYRAHQEEIGYRAHQEENPTHVSIINKTFEEWHAQIRQITTAPLKEAANWFRLIVDSDTLYGDKGLTEALRDHVMMEFEQKPRLLRMMVDDNAEWRPPLGFFDQLIPLGFFNIQGGPKAKGKIDIECNGLNILADIVRIYALKAGVRNRNTLERLTGLVRQGELSSEYANSVRAAYEALLDILLSHQIQRAEKGKRLDRLIKPNQLSAVDYEILRMSMRVIKGFQEKLQAQVK
jgi:CBS domain-containing protein